jgi:hypothetical protein
MFGRLTSHLVPNFSGTGFNLWLKDAWVRVSHTEYQQFRPTQSYLSQAASLTHGEYLKLFNIFSST